MSVPNEGGVENPATPSNIGDEANNGKGVVDNKNDVTGQKMSGSTFYKEKLSKLESENIKLRSAIDDQERTRLEETQNYKALYESEAEKRQAADEKSNKLLESFKLDRKQSAIRSEAMKLGIREEAVSDIGLFDSDSVIIETTDQGSINILGAKEYVENLKSSKPYMFNDSTPPNVNNGGTHSSNGGLTEWSAEKILKMEVENPKEYKKYMKSKYGVA